MNLDRLIVKDMFAFTEPVDLPVGEIGPGLIAIVGDNGLGKTSLIEVVPGVNYQQLPGREDDHPKAYARSRRASLEYHFTLPGQGSYRAVLNIDGESGDTDGVFQALTPDGWLPVGVSDGKVSTLKRALADFGIVSYDLFINSNFAAQGRGDEFRRAKPSARKDLFAEFLGLSGLLAKAKTASEAAALVETVRDRMRAVRAALEQQIGGVDEDGIVACDAQIVREQAALAKRLANEDTAIAQAAARLATMQDAVAAHGAATLRIQSLTAARHERRVERQQLGDERATIATTLKQDIANATTTRDRALAAVDAAERDETIHVKLAATLADLNEKIAGNQTLLARGDEIRAADAQLETHTGAIRLARTILAASQADLQTNAEELRAVERDLANLKPVEQSRDRAAQDAELLAGVPCGGEGSFAACQFLQNAIAARGSIAELEGRLAPKAQLADRVAALVRARETLQREVRDLTTGIAEAEVRRAASAQVAAFLPKLVLADERVRELQTARARALADADEAEATRAEHLKQRRTTTIDTFQATVTAARERHDDALARVDAQVTTIERILAVLMADLTAAEQDLAAAAAGNIEATALQQEIAGLRAARDRDLAQQASLEGQRQQLARDRATLLQRRAEAAALDTRIAEVNVALVEWRDLAKSIGKGGLADLEIDEAGPTITATANALLAKCLDARFSLELVTQVEKADGGLKDSFTVRVMDNTDDRGWRDLRTFSGGQRTVIQEALMCAIALYVNERSTLPIRTLWRDETGAALDATNAIHYVEMLRAVREIGGLHQIYFVTHNAEAAALADAQIVVAGGGARIERPPYETAA